MKKKILLRIFGGFPVGITIGYLISIIISLIHGHGKYLAVNELLINSWGSEIAAVLVQALACGILGAVGASASLIWENNNMSLLKRSVIYFIILTAAMLPIAWLMHWVEFNVKSTIIYLAVYCGIFCIIWLIQYCLILFEVKKINQKLTNKQD